MSFKAQLLKFSIRKGGKVPFDKGFRGFKGTRNLINENAYIIDAIRTPFGRYAGGLAPVRADDLGAIPIKALMERNPSINWEKVDDIIYGCANQAGEDNRNVGRMSALLASVPYQVPATTINRLCGSSWMQ